MDTELPRLFIAVPIDERWREQLAKQCLLLQSKLPFQKWTHPQDYHITLKFLGDTTADQMEQIQQQLANVSEAFSPFELTEKGWGTFGPHTAPSILWAGVGGDLSTLTKLQQKVDSSMAELGFPQENRAFHPHLTIARRYKGKGPLTSPIKQYLPEADESPIDWSVKEIKLYQSHLQKKPMYEPIATFKLGN
jgi:2'-5' RNA ligase